MKFIIDKHLLQTNKYFFLWVKKLFSIYKFCPTGIIEDIINNTEEYTPNKPKSSRVRWGVISGNKIIFRTADNLFDKVYEIISVILEIILFNKQELIISFDYLF